MFCDTTLPTLDLSYANSLALLLPINPRTVQLVLVGCGGTGSWLAPHVARVARMLIDKFNRQVEVNFIDPDRVEEKNIYRQNFCMAEVGEYKAVTLARRCGQAWNLPILAHTCALSDAAGTKISTFDLRVIAGCVDRASARREIWKAAGYGNAWWLDCGNEKSSGQVLLGRGAVCTEDPFSFPGYCSWLPSPAIQHPDLLKDQPAPAETDVSSLSCADMALLNAQGLGVNPQIAATAGDYLWQMLVYGNLRRMATYLDLAAGSTRSTYITREAVMNTIDDRTRKFWSK